MDEFPSNSHSPKPPPEEKAEVKHVQKVVEGKVTRRKKPLGKRVKEMFLADGEVSVADYVFGEVLIPALKDMMTDAVSQGFERMVYGESRSNNRRTRPTTGAFGSSPNQVNYTRYSSSNQRKDERPTNRRQRGSHEFDEIILGSRAEAQDVIGSLRDIIDKYDTVSVQDLYEMVGVDFHHTDSKWGWTNLDDAIVRRISNGYLLDLPKTEPID